MGMRAKDAEILALHHFEQLSLRECAEVLDISHPAACNRYLRALQRIRTALADPNHPADQEQ
jgi:RNA polymerase sigma-70 factor (ECF subfamily)